MGFTLPADWNGKVFDTMAALGTCKNCQHEVAVMKDGTVEHFWEGHHPYNGQGSSQRCGWKVVYRVGTPVPSKHSSMEKLFVDQRATMYHCECSDPQLDDGDSDG